MIEIPADSTSMSRGAAFRRMIGDVGGATATEWALMAFLIAVAVISAVGLLGAEVVELFRSFPQL